MEASVQNALMCCVRVCRKHTRGGLTSCPRALPGRLVALCSPLWVVHADVIIDRLRQQKYLSAVVTRNVCHAEIYRAKRGSGIRADFPSGLQDLRARLFS
jgi:hypothetical protein